MKNLFTILTLTLFTVYSGISQSCFDCTFKGTITIDVTGDFNVFATSTVTADAYYWEVCDGTTQIIGSNTSPIVNLDYTEGEESTLRLVYFEDGVCSTDCILLNSKSVVDPCGTGTPIECCVPEFFSSYICGQHLSKGKIVKIDTCDNETIDHIDWTLTEGYFINNSFSPEITTYGWEVALTVEGYNCDENKGLGVTAIFYFNNGCPPLTIFQNFDVELNPSPIGFKINLIQNQNTVSFKGKNIDGYKINILDSKGTFIYKNKKINEKINIDQASDGVLFYQILDKNNNSVKSGKIIKN